MSMSERLKQMIKDANDAKDALIRWKDSQDINDEVFLLSLGKYIAETFARSHKEKSSAQDQLNTHFLCKPSNPNSKNA
jgi:hypothetical protein